MVKTPYLVLDFRYIGLCDASHAEYQFFADSAGYIAYTLCSMLLDAPFQPRGHTLSGMHDGLCDSSRLAMISIGFLRLHIGYSAAKWPVYPIRKGKAYNICNHCTVL